MEKLAAYGEISMLMEKLSDSALLSQYDDIFVVVFIFCDIF
jgi:hypothetical protein